MWLSAKRLHDALGAQRLTTFDLRVPQLATADLCGETVLEVRARGKHILMRVSGGHTLHSHLRMDGTWSISAADLARPNRGRPGHLIRARLGNSRWLATGYRIHDLRLIATADEDELVGHLGPDLLGSDWDEELALARLRAAPERPISEALLDQRNLAGIGNLYKSEVLFIKGVNPWTPVGSVSALVAVVRTAQALLRRNRNHPAQSTTGSTRRGEEHWVYRRARQACRRCGQPIRTAKQGPSPHERATYWCPHCQPGL